MQRIQPRTTQLGATDLEITRVGFGAWAIGGGGRELQEDEETITKASPAGTESRS